MRLEPILVHHALLNGFTSRFNTTFISFEREPSGHIVSKVQDNLTKQTYHIGSKYLFRADGARSQVLRQLQIPLIKRPGQGLAINIMAKVDILDYVENRMGNLHWIIQPGEEFPAWGLWAVVRIVKPWNEYADASNSVYVSNSFRWMFILLPAPGTGVDFETTDKEYLK
jgi:flavin-dependent dehydrogenase